jgi:hypothetical protein
VKQTKVIVEEYTVVIHRSLNADCTNIRSFAQASMNDASKTEASKSCACIEEITEHIRP